MKPKASEGSIGSSSISTSWSSSNVPSRSHSLSRSDVISTSDSSQKVFKIPVNGWNSGWRINCDWTQNKLNLSRRTLLKNLLGSSKSLKQYIICSQSKNRLEWNTSHPLVKVAALVWYFTRHSSSSPWLEYFLHRCLNSFLQLETALRQLPFRIASIFSNRWGISREIITYTARSIRGLVKRWRKSHFILRHCDSMIMVVLSTGISCGQSEQAHNLHCSALCQLIYK